MVFYFEVVKRHNLWYNLPKLKLKKRKGVGPMPNFRRMAEAGQLAGKECTEAKRGYAQFNRRDTALKLGPDDPPNASARRDFELALEHCARKLRA